MREKEKNRHLKRLSPQIQADDRTNIQNTAVQDLRFKTPFGNEASRRKVYRQTKDIYLQSRDADFSAGSFFPNAKLKEAKEENWPASVCKPDAGRLTLKQRHQSNIRLTLSTPATNASTSSFVLYKPKEARTVPSTPIRRIKGSAQ